MKVLRPVLAVGALVLLAGPAFAQDRYASIEARAGYTSAPAGNTTDLDNGQSLKGQSSFGGSIALGLANRVHLGVTLDWAHHSQKQPPDGDVVGGPNDPQYNVFHTFLKVSFDLVDKGRFSVSLNAGPGMIFFSPNDVLKDQGAEGDRHFALNGGATITWWFADRIGIVLSPQADIALSKSSGNIFTDKSALFLPLTAGLKFKL